MTSIMGAIFLSVAVLLAWPVFAEDVTSDNQKVNTKVEIKAAGEVKPLKLLAKPLSSIGSCGGCLSSPTFCCDSKNRPVCENGNCYCWADNACQ